MFVLVDNISISCELAGVAIFFKTGRKGGDQSSEENGKLL